MSYLRKSHLKSFDTFGVQVKTLAREQTKNPNK